MSLTTIITDLLLFFGGYLIGLSRRRKSPTFTTWSSGG
jgi:hypothetical protein